MVQQSLARMEAGDFVQQAAATIKQQARRLDTLIDQLLDVSRIEQGQFSIDLRGLVTRTVDNVRLTLTRHTLTLTGHDEPIPMLGDALRLEQVVQNLLNNAVKYSPAGSPIEVVLARAQGEACLEITDHGIGIPADAQPRLFDLFFRANNADKYSAGFGIGLYVVGEIVQRHGGRLEVESAEGQGSTFRVILPLHAAGGA